eukprot:247053-Prymnesium_polylepis.1
MGATSHGEQGATSHGEQGATSHGEQGATSHGDQVGCSSCRSARRSIRKSRSGDPSAPRWNAGWASAHAVRVVFRGASHGPNMALRP